MAGEGMGGERRADTARVARARKSERGALDVVGVSAQVRLRAGVGVGQCYRSRGDMGVGGYVWG